MWGPTKARLFLHELIPQIPLFGTTEFKFMFILKRFKMMKKNSKVARRKENGGQILLKMSLVEPKDSKDENFDDLKSFKKTKIGKSFENRVRKSLFRNHREGI